MTTTEKAIIRTLLYFDIFNHPLEKNELYELICTSPDRSAFEKDLEILIEKQLVSQEGEYFYISKSKLSVEERVKKYERALNYHKIARFITAIIYRLPFVRGVMISGSLSKNAISKNDDIDYFIIAKKGRLWLCKFFILLFKKIFLLNSRKYLCINYFIDEVCLEIPDKNIFTATEIAFLIPLRNQEIYKQFVEANSWTKLFFPNRPFNLDRCRNNSDPFYKKLLEKLLNGKTGDKLDTYFMELSVKKNKKRYGLADQKLISSNIRNDKLVSKNHFPGYQHTIIERYNSKISAFRTENQIDLSI